MSSTLAKKVLVQSELTLKALANFSPGFALKPWDKMHVCFVATLKELQRSSAIATQPFQGLTSSLKGAPLPRVAKPNAGLELANGFQR